MILRIGHTELHVTDLDTAHAFYVDALGFVEAGQGDGTLYLRGVEEFDTWTLALVESERPGLGHFAFRVDEEGDLDQLEALHDGLGLPTRRVPAESEPGQGAALRVLGPEGFPIEFYREFEQVSLPKDGVVLPMRGRGLRHDTAPLRIDHINMRTKDMPGTLGFLVDQLGFSTSELIEKDDEVFAAWLRRHTGSHDIAVLDGAESSFHHLAYIVPEAGSLVRIADSLSDHGFQEAVEFGPARHGVTNALFLYIRDPSGNRIELYTGDYVRDRDLPPIRWSWDSFLSTGRSWWGAPAPETFAETNPIVPGWLEVLAEATG